jgi:hypothetical protein
MLDHKGHVTQPHAIVRYFDTGYDIQSPAGGSQVRRAADAAHTRRDNQSVERATAYKDLLEAAEHRAAAPSIGDAPIGDLHLNVEISLNSVDRQLKDSFLGHVHLTCLCPSPIEVFDIKQENLK